MKKTKTTHASNEVVSIANATEAHLSEQHSYASAMGIKKNRIPKDFLSGVGRFEIGRTRKCCNSH